MVLKFKIKIEGLAKPPVWRKVEVPATFTFLELHRVIQTVFGWENAHLWRFEPRTKGRLRGPAFHIEEPYEDDDCGWWGFSERLIASETEIARIFSFIRELVYIYDYGDYWKHSVKLEEVTEDLHDYAVCTGGKGTTPPEDCGGIGGYECLKEAFATHNEEETYRDWLGLEENQGWDPNSFCAEELKRINMELKHI